MRKFAKLILSITAISAPVVIASCASKNAGTATTVKPSEITPAEVVNPVIPEAGKKVKLHFFDDSSQSSSFQEFFQLPYETITHIPNGLTETDSFTFHGWSLDRNSSMANVVSVDEKLMAQHLNNGVVQLFPVFKTSFKLTVINPNTNEHHETWIRTVPGSSLKKFMDTDETFKRFYNSIVSQIRTHDIKRLFIADSNDIEVSDDIVPEFSQSRYVIKTELTVKKEATVSIDIQNYWDEDSKSEAQALNEKFSLLKLPQGVPVPNLINQINSILGDFFPYVNQELEHADSIFYTLPKFYGLEGLDNIAQTPVSSRIIIRHSITTSPSVAPPKAEEQAKMSIVNDPFSLTEQGLRMSSLLTSVPFKKATKINLNEAIKGYAVTVSGDNGRVAFYRSFSAFIDEVRGTKFKDWLIRTANGQLIPHVNGSFIVPDQDFSVEIIWQPI